MSEAASLPPDDPAKLRAMIAALEAENAAMRAETTRLTAVLKAHEALVQALQIRIAKLQRQKFGASSEKIEREIEQLELALEALEVAASAAREPEEEPKAEPAVAEPSSMRRKPKVSEATPRERIVLDPGDACPDCGGELRLVGEDMSEILELISARLKVIETARPKKSCRRCEKITQTPAPSRPIPRSMAGPGLLAHILVSKFDDHLPLYRQNEIFARMGAEIPASTLVDWCGQGVRVLDRARRLEGLGKGVKEGRIWTYLRDDRPWGGTAPPGIAYFVAPEHHAAAALMPHFGRGRAMIAPIAAMRAARISATRALRWARIMRMLCPQPQSTAWSASPSVPLRAQRARRPSVFMCPITGSIALRRRRSRRSAGVIPRRWPEMNASVVCTPWPR